MRMALEAAEAKIERLSAEPCPHPSGCVIDGVCQLCKAEVWLWRIGLRQYARTSGRRARSTAGPMAASRRSASC